MLLSLIMIPQVLLLVPLFVEVKQLGLLDSYWALILPYTAHGQIVASGLYFARLRAVGDGVGGGGG